jgi:hypothetical protein
LWIEKVGVDPTALMNGTPRACGDTGETAERVASASSSSSSSSTSNRRDSGSAAEEEVSFIDKLILRLPTFANDSASIYGTFASTKQTQTPHA